MEGELIIDIDGKVETFAAGKGIAAPSNSMVTVKNSSTGTPARLAVSTLLAPGATSEVHLVSAPGVKVFGTARKTFTDVPSVIDLVQQVPEYDVGFRTPNHMMNFPHFMLMLQGSTQFAYLDGFSETVVAGAQGEMYPKRPGYMANAGSAKNSFLVTWLASAGATALTSAVSAPTAAPAPPNTGTGSGDLIESSRQLPWYTLASVLIGAGVMVTAAAVIRDRRRASPPRA